MPAAFSTPLKKSVFFELSFFTLQDLMTRSEAHAPPRHQTKRPVPKACHWDSHSSCFGNCCAFLQSLGGKSANAASLTAWELRGSIWTTACHVDGRWGVPTQMPNRGGGCASSRLAPFFQLSPLAVLRFFFPFNQELSVRDLFAPFLRHCCRIEETADAVREHQDMQGTCARNAPACFEHCSAPPLFLLC